MEPATDERRNQTRNRKLTALGALNRLRICSWTHVSCLFVWPLWYLAMSRTCNARLPSPALLTNLSTQLWFYTNFTHHITFEVSVQVNLPDQVNEFKDWGDKIKKDYNHCFHRKPSFKTTKKKLHLTGSGFYFLAVRNKCNLDKPQENIQNRDSPLRELKTLTRTFPISSLPLHLLQWKWKAEYLTKSNCSFKNYQQERYTLKTTLIFWEPNMQVIPAWYPFKSYIH